ncbi:hypothetical protein B2M23_11315 [Eubacterium limosum]|uniref:Uncharacterized protein n=1 Tax=Eubacterium limosum TaxID=1736 RepID=A0AAC9QUB8_EUBLI|nr:hypothetical protein B2M23_11315 [Eubacterium limosum]
MTHFNQPALNESALMSEKRLIGSNGGWAFGSKQVGQHANRGGGTGLLVGVHHQTKPTKKAGVDMTEKWVPMNSIFNFKPETFAGYCRKTRRRLASYRSVAVETGEKPAKKEILRPRKISSRTWASRVPPVLKKMECALGCQRKRSICYLPEAALMGLYCQTKRTTTASTIF